MSDENSENIKLTEHEVNSDNKNIWLRLCKKAARLRYGSFTCRFDVHQGEIRRAEYFGERESIT